MATMVDDATDVLVRSKLGPRLVTISALGIFFIATVLLVLTDATERPETAKLVFTALLPLLGTWVGTVLAFYYSKDNFETASRETKDLVRSFGQRLTATKIQDTMMHANAIVKVVVPAGGLDAVTVAEVSAAFAKTGANDARISRLHIVDPNGVCIAIVHRSIWLEMLEAGSQNTPPLDRTVATLKDVLDQPYPSRAGKTFRDYITQTLSYVAEDKTLAEAKAALEAKPHCQDVIVTATGRDTERMLGWVSNVDITRLSMAN